MPEMVDRPGRPQLSEERLRAFVGAVFDAYYDWHIQTGYMEMSSQMDALLRLRPGELPRSFYAWLDRVHPDDRRQTLINNQRAARLGGVYEGEYRLRRGDGTYVDVHDRGVILRDDHGLTAHMIGAIRDITAERLAERAMREAAEVYNTLFEQASNPAYRISGDGVFLDANAAGIAFLGTTGSRLLRRDVGSLWGAAAAAAVQEALKPAGKVAELEIEVAVGASTRSLTLTLMPCRFRGEATCFALGTDITGHRELSRALEVSRESLQRQASALEDANTALRVILDQRNRDRAELELGIVDNVESMIMPLLDRLQRHLAGTPEAIYVDAAVHNLRELVHPFAQALESAVSLDARLTRREREIVNLIRAGKSSNEIARALYISPTTVAFHRKNLRRKLGLPPRGPALAAHLALLPERGGHDEARVDA
jgi:PAS domain-containing protein/DNA-binding CsgD family transcriptional regulator